jgi:hypothetical protein
MHECRPRLSVRATVRGSYRQEGVLVIREGARLQCSAPGCVFTIRNMRALVMKSASSILAERVVVEVPQVNISGIIQGNTISILAATLNIGKEGVLLSSDRSNTTTAVSIDVNPSNLIQARPRRRTLLCSALHCTHLTLRANPITCHLTAPRSAGPAITSSPIRLITCALGHAAAAAPPTHLLLPPFLSSSPMAVILPVWSATR